MTLRRKSTIVMNVICAVLAAGRSLHIAVNAGSATTHHLSRIIYELKILETRRVQYAWRTFSARKVTDHQ